MNLWQLDGRLALVAANNRRRVADERRKETIAAMPATNSSMQRAHQCSPSQRPPQRSLVASGIALAAVTVLALCAGSPAYAGEWMQVSCVNPDETVAGSAGWISEIAGGGYGSSTDTACGPESPMFALLSSDAAVGAPSSETLRYVPPAGSSLVGGDLDIGMYASGYGTGAQGTATAYTPEVSPDAADIVLQCAHGASPCSPMGNEFLGELEVPRGRGGDIYLSAGCAGTAGASCDEGASGGAWSQVKLWEAHLRLANGSTPGALDGIVGGALLAGGAGARGTQSLTFAATDYAGPGVYSVTVQADGQTLYSATPDTNSGRCTGRLERQRCLGLGGRDTLVRCQPAVQAERAGRTADRYDVGARRRAHTAGKRH